MFSEPILHLLYFPGWQSEGVVIARLLRSTTRTLLVSDRQEFLLISTIKFASDKEKHKISSWGFFSAYISEFEQNIILSSTFATQALSRTDNNLTNNQLHLLKSLSLSKMKLIIGKEYSEPNRYLWLSS